MDDTATQKGSRTRLLPISNMSIAELISKINPKDYRLFKYIPNQLLDDAQRNAKQRALDEDNHNLGIKNQNRIVEKAVEHFGTQVKNIDNTTPTSNPDIRVDDTPKMEYYKTCITVLVLGIFCSFQYTFHIEGKFV